jgi:hypothetical protein
VQKPGAQREPQQKGKAKITLSFPAWREGNVASATFEVPVIDAKKADPSGGEPN